MHRPIAGIRRGRKAGRNHVSDCARQKTLAGGTDMADVRRMDGPVFNTACFPGTPEGWRWQDKGFNFRGYGNGLSIVSRDNRWSLGPLQWPSGLESGATHWLIVLVGLLGKFAGWVGFAFALAGGSFTLRVGFAILTNKLIMWISLSMLFQQGWQNHRYAQSSSNSVP
jgi:hypothetical protein